MAIKKVVSAKSVNFTGCGFGEVNKGPYFQGVVDSDGDELLIETINGKCYVEVSAFKLGGNQGYEGSTSFTAVGKAYITDDAGTDTEIGNVSLTVSISKQTLTMTGTVAGKAESYSLSQTYGNPVMYI